MSRSMTQLTVRGWCPRGSETEKPTYTVSNERETTKELWGVAKRPRGAIGAARLTICYHTTI